MNDQVIIRLAGEPVGKGRPRFGNGRTFTPAKTRSYESALKYAAQEAMVARPLLTGPLEVLIVAAFPIPASFSKRKRMDAVTGVLRPAKRPDWDNLAKVCDALNGVVWTDDALIVDGHVRKIYSDKPELVVSVTPLSS